MWREFYSLIYIPNKYPYTELKKQTIDGSRKYMTPDGFAVPSVTTILDATKPEEAKQFFPEISVICTPASEHLDIAHSLLSVGSHLLIEKPLSNSQVGVVDLVKECQNNEKKMVVGYNLRFLNSLNQFKGYLDYGIVGDSLSVRCEVGQYLPNWRPDFDYRLSVSARENRGGGVLLELSHEIDYLMWIFGEIEWVQAILSKQSKLEIDVEDSAHLILGFCRSGSRTGLIATLNLDFIRHDASRKCIVIGEKGTLLWDGITNQVFLLNAEEREWKILYEDDSGLDASYLNEWLHFKQCLEGIKDPLVSGIDGLRVLQVVDAARQSSTTGCRERVEKNEFKSSQSR